MNPPQAVSSKYVRNLICKGSNSSFEIDAITQSPATSPTGIPCGFYYTAAVKSFPPFELIEKEGATPESAVSRCLEAFGVTFR